MTASAVRAADNLCQEIREPGTLEIATDPHQPERVVDIFWSDPETVAHDFSWQNIALSLVWGRYSCGDDLLVEGTRKALVAAGDKCATERVAVIRQLVGGTIKQGVEATWKPTRTLWKCEQRLARRKAEKAARDGAQRPTSQTPKSDRQKCIDDGNAPNLCDDVAGVFGQIEQCSKAGYSQQVCDVANKLAPEQRRMVTLDMIRDALAATAKEEADRRARLAVPAQDLLGQSDPAGELAIIASSSVKVRIDGEELPGTKVEGGQMHLTKITTGAHDIRLYDSSIDKNVSLTVVIPRGRRLELIADGELALRESVPKQQSTP